MWVLARGFERPSGPGALLRGLIHRELGMGVEVDSGALMDGRADPAKVMKVTVSEVSGASVAVIAIEDLIADRLAQDAAHGSTGRPEMRMQAVRLWQLGIGTDRDYLDRRIIEETSGTYRLIDLEQLARCV